MPETVSIVQGRPSVLQVSKSRKLPVLLSSEEMADLLGALGSFHIFDVSRPLSLDAAEISKDTFLKVYGDYVEGIRCQELVDEGALKAYFSAIFTQSTSGVHAQRLANGKFLIRSKTPSIQLQRHHFILDRSFHAGVIGRDSISWGIQFSYPHLFMDPKTKAIGKVEDTSAFPNTALFKRLTKWIRIHTRPTPFAKEGIKPIRLGKGCFAWINHHPQLAKKGLYVPSEDSPDPH